MRKSRPPLISWGRYFLSQAKGELSQTEIDARRVGRTIRKIWLRYGTNMRRASSKFWPNGDVVAALRVTALRCDLMSDLGGPSGSLFSLGSGVDAR